MLLSVHMHRLHNKFHNLAKDRSKLRSDCYTFVCIQHELHNLRRHFPQSLSYIHLQCLDPELFTVSYLTVSCRILIHRKTLNLTLNKVKFGVFSLYFRASEEYN